MQESRIDHVEYGGVRYEFVDQENRDKVSALTSRVTNLYNESDQKIKDEKNRAMGAEQALQNSKVSVVPGKQLSTNDFNNDYKDMLDNPKVMVGATEDEDGEQGDVPAPTSEEMDLYLQGDGSWSKPQDTTYNNATHTVSGLMSASDKVKLDGLDAIPDAEDSSHVEFGNGYITELLGSGKSVTTVFNNDGSITQTIVRSGSDDVELTTVFNSDGSITRTRS